METFKSKPKDFQFQPLRAWSLQSRATLWLEHTAPELLLPLWVLSPFWSLLFHPEATWRVCEFLCPFWLEPRACECLLAPGVCGWGLYEDQPLGPLYWAHRGFLHPLWLGGMECWGTGAWSRERVSFCVCFTKLRSFQGDKRWRRVSLHHNSDVDAQCRHRADWKP